VLNGLRNDSEYVVQRPGARELLKYVFPAVRKAYRTTKIPTSLATLEAKFEQRVMWPRSIYKYSVFKDNIKPYTEIGLGECEYTSLIDEYDHCWCPSTRFELDLHLKRNIRSLAHAAGLPNGGKKREQIQNAIQYNQAVGLRIERCWAIVPGYRTQQSDPKEPKIRLVWAYPCHIWVWECEALDDAITKTQAKARELKHAIQVFYFDARSQLKDWMNNFKSKVVEWVYIDATQYDSSVQGAELTAGWTYFAPIIKGANCLGSTLRVPPLLCLMVSSFGKGECLLDRRARTSLMDGPMLVILLKSSNVSALINSWYVF